MNNRNKTLIMISVVVLAVLAMFLYANFRTAPVTKEGYYFDTHVSITVYSKHDARCIDDCMKMCERYDNLFSKTAEGSDVWNINHSNAKPVTIDSETYRLIEDSLVFCEETNGALDITVEGLINVWGFEDAENVSTLPSEKVLEEALSHVGYQNVILGENNTITVNDSQTKIDLGCIAKGYIADRIKEYLISKNVKSAIVSLGGNIVVIGSKPDKSEYKIGIKDPDSQGIISSVSVRDKSVVTSGTYERYIELDNTKYHHILDTKTGYPVNNNIKSVTITSDSSEIGDALSTACLILGEKESKALLEKYNAEAVFY